MKKTALKEFIREEIISILTEDDAANKAAQDAKKIAIDKEIVALQKKKAETEKNPISEEDKQLFEIFLDNSDDPLYKTFESLIDAENYAKECIENKECKKVRIYKNHNYLKTIHKNLNELARVASVIKIGDKEQVEAAKELYAGKWKADLIDIVEKAGDKGISQVDLAIALGKGSQQSINPTVRELIILKALTQDGASIDKKEKTKTEKPSPTTSAKTEKDEEADVEIEDNWEKPDTEFDVPEDEPKAKDIKAAEKTLNATSSHAGKLSPEDEDRFNKLKSGINTKISKLSKMKKAERLKSDDLKVLKQLINRADVKKLFKQKGVSIKDLVSDVIA